MTEKIDKTEKRSSSMAYILSLLPATTMMEIFTVLYLVFYNRTNIYTYVLGGLMLAIIVGVWKPLPGPGSDLGYKIFAGILGVLWLPFMLVYISIALLVGVFRLVTLVFYLLFTSKPLSPPEPSDIDFKEKDIHSAEICFVMEDKGIIQDKRITLRLENHFKTCLIEEGILNLDALISANSDTLNRVRRSYYQKVMHDTELVEYLKNATP